MKKVSIITSVVSAVRKDLLFTTQKMTKSNLKPLDLSEDVKKYEAFSEKKEVSFIGCKHKTVKYVDQSLRCDCGATWTGSRLNELYSVLTT